MVSWSPTLWMLETLSLKPPISVATAHALKYPDPGAPSTAMDPYVSRDIPAYSNANFHKKNLFKKFRNFSGLYVRLILLTNSDLEMGPFSFLYGWIEWLWYSNCRGFLYIKWQYHACVMLFAAVGRSFKAYRHGVSVYATRITDQTWHRYRQLLTDLHKRRISRHLMLKELIKQGFHPSIKQLNAQMRKWNLEARGLDIEKTAEHMSTMLDDELSLLDGVVDLNEIEEQKFTCQEEPQDNIHPSCNAHHSRPVLDDQLDSLSMTALEYSQIPGEDCPTTTTAHFEDNALRVRLQSLALKLQLSRNNLADSAIQVPSECCCLDFFNGTGYFARAWSLYSSCLESLESSTSLHFVLMLINYLNVCGEGHVDQSVQSMIRQALNHFLSLAARIDVKNIVVDSIIHELSGLSLNLTKIGIDFPDVDFMPTHFICWRDLITPQIRPTSQKLSNLEVNLLHSCTPDASSLCGMKEVHIHSILERCRTVLIRECYNIEAVLFWICPSWTSNSKHSILLEQRTLVTLAGYISSYLSRDLDSHPSFYRYDQACVSQRQSSILFEAIGMLVMTKLGSILQQDQGNSRESFVDRVSYAFQSSIAGLLPSDTDPIFVQQESIRVTSLELRRLCWIYGLDDADLHRSNLHGGECHFGTLWTSLRRDVCDFDQERTLLEKRVFLTTQKSDRRRGFADDNESMSISTSSTDSSVSRFRACGWSTVSEKKENLASSQHSTYAPSDNFGFTFGSDIDDTTSQRNTKGECEDQDQAEVHQMQSTIDYPWTAFAGAGSDLELYDLDSELSFEVGAASQF